MSDKCICKGVDFRGQHLSERMSQIIIIAASVSVCANACYGLFFSLPLRCREPRRAAPIVGSLADPAHAQPHTSRASSSSPPPPHTQVVAFIVGYQKQSFEITFYGWAAGTTLAMLLCCPDWCWFNRNQVDWLEPFGKKRIAEQKEARKYGGKNTKKKKKET